MGRQAENSVTFPDGVTRVGYGLKLRSTTSTGCSSLTRPRPASTSSSRRAARPKTMLSPKPLSWCFEPTAQRLGRPEDDGVGDGPRRTRQNAGSALRQREELPHRHLRATEPHRNERADARHTGAREPLQAALPLGNNRPGKRPRRQAAPHWPDELPDYLRLAAVALEHPLQGTRVRHHEPWMNVPYPEAGRKEVRIPSEAAFDHFTAWLTALYPDWRLPTLFVTVKAARRSAARSICVRSAPSSSRTGS